MSEPSKHDFKEPRVWRIQHLAQAKLANRKLTMLTSYDALTARIFESAGVDTILVGDSYGNVQLGYDSTLPVTIDDMERATAAVARATSRPLIIADLPFGTYEASPTQAFESASRLMRVGANAVKLEGGTARTSSVSLLTSSGIPVVGHLGFTPQSENTLGGPRIQGRGTARNRLMEDALALQEAGACMIVLELIPAHVAREITNALEIPTIGIGAGPDTSGQVLVWSDMAGMTEWTPSFAKRFAELGAALENAASTYCQEVRDGTFPTPDYYYAE
ncbi:MAG: 3-methyl-2-oxobutanoate hydroxymethyltransferase [Actinomycetaceae bacterium]|nr:3-methyl-2-oxobutanoate hydroxymethyltransferase [Actinomycetaceae bacterium]